MCKKKFNMTKIFEYFMIFAAILNCHSVYDVGVIDIHLEVMVVIFLILTLASKRCIKSIDKATLIFLVIYQIPLLIMADNSYRITYFIKFVILTVVIYLLVCTDADFESNIIEIFVKIIGAVSIVSLFFYVFTNIIPLIKPTSAYLMQWGTKKYVLSYYGMYFNTSPSKVFMYKNSAIFTEAPVWSAILCLAIILDTFINQQKNKKRIILFIITLITTESVTSYIFLILYFISLIYFSGSKKKTIGTKMVLFFALIVSAIIGGIIGVYIMGKKRNMGYSYYLRLDDLMTAISIFKSHPLFGVGFGKEEILNQWNSNWRNMLSGVGQSSDLAYYLPGGGIWFCIPFIYGIYHISTSEKNKMKKVIIFGLFLYLLVITRLCATVLFIIFAAIGIANAWNGCKDRTI